MTSYDTIGGENLPIMDRPLFGQPTLWDKVRDGITFGITGLFTLITLFGALIKSDSDSVHTKGFNIYFAICLIVLCASHYVLIYWYRQGDVDPKFRLLIYINTTVVILLNICAELYIYGV